MKAMIFAAGLGTRLKPFTDNHPKALYPVCGKPLLYHVIKKLKNSGFNELIINVHHFADQIIQYLQQQNYFDINIQISDEQNKLLDTGGGIKKASSFFDNKEPFLVHNVDILSNADLNALYNYHLQEDKNIATLLVKERKTSRYLLWDESKKLMGWINSQTNEIKSPYAHIDSEKYMHLAFSGIHVLSSDIFKYMADFPDKFSIIDFYLSIANKEVISYHKPNDLTMVDVGKTDSLSQAEAIINQYYL